MHPLPLVILWPTQAAGAIGHQRDPSASGAPEEVQLLAYRSLGAYGALICGKLAMGVLEAACTGEGTGESPGDGTPRESQAGVQVEGPYWGLGTPFSAPSEEEGRWKCKARGIRANADGGALSSSRHCCGTGPWCATWRFPSGPWRSDSLSRCGARKGGAGAGSVHHNADGTDLHHSPHPPPAAVAPVNSPQLPGHPKQSQQSQTRKLSRASSSEAETRALALRPLREGGRICWLWTSSGERHATGRDCRGPWGGTGQRAEVWEAGR